MLACWDNMVAPSRAPTDYASRDRRARSEGASLVAAWPAPAFLAEPLAIGSHGPMIDVKESAAGQCGITLQKGLRVRKLSTDCRRLLFQYHAARLSHAQFSRHRARSSFQNDVSAIQTELPEVRR
jgi:hypothetical protein